MLGLLAHLDTLVFNLVNHAFNYPWFDTFMLQMTKIDRWHIPLACLWAVLVVFGREKGRMAAFLLIPAIWFSDSLSSHFLKDFFARARPCHDLPDVRLIAGCRDSFSFPSSHAVNMFTGAAVFARIYRSWKIVVTCFTVATVVAYSRVYIGVHYPFDVISGSLFGILIGSLFAFLGQRLYARSALLKIHSGSVSQHEPQC